MSPPLVALIKGMSRVPDMVVSLGYGSSERTGSVAPTPTTLLLWTIFLILLTIERPCELAVRLFQGSEWHIGRTRRLALTKLRF